MYINKFKCENPQLSTFKNGVAFCAGCAKNVYDANVVDLKSLLTESDSICGRVSTSKIAWMQRSIIGATFVATAMLTPIDAFAQSIASLDKIVHHKDSSKVLFTGIVVNESDEIIEEVKVLLFAGDHLVAGNNTNKNGCFKIEINLNTLIDKELKVEFRHPAYVIVKYIEISELGFQDLLVKLNKHLDEVLDGIVINRFSIPLIDTSTQGNTFGRSDLKNMPR